MKWLYLMVDVFTVIVPFLFSFHPKIKFYKYWKPFFLANAIVAVLFIFCDIIFTKAEIWSFNSRYVTGLSLFNLPIEEVLFFICIPFSCVFTYFCLNKFFNFSWRENAERLFAILFFLALIIIGCIFFDRTYTSTTLISCGVICLGLKFIFKINWLGNFVTVYLFLLIPFFIVNGILTGTGLKEAVVQYNSSKIIGLRMLTIPVEDLIYGFELVLLNLFLFKLFTNKMVSKDVEVERK